VTAQVKENTLTAAFTGKLKPDCSQRSSAHDMELMLAALAQDVIELN
jgi:hypothetical protein